MKIRKKAYLDARVAAESGESLVTVAVVTRAFVEAIMEVLAKQDEVHIDGFGRLRMVVEGTRGSAAVLHNSRGPKRMRAVRILRKFRVHFAKGNQFKRLLREKYGPHVEKKS
jgi:nucleoid DNA-binding protein